MIGCYYGSSDEGVCERWVHDPYFQYFTGEEFFRLTDEGYDEPPRELATSLRRAGPHARSFVTLMPGSIVNPSG
jgi:hypothetical protein